MSLVITNLTKQYNKNKTGLSNYSITIDKGVLGLLGPNGAGKSTLMKIIATISKPTEGTLFLDGEDIVKNPDRIRKVLGSATSTSFAKRTKCGVCSDICRRILVYIPT